MDDAQTFTDRISELENKVAEQGRYILELESDPYRPVVGGQYGEVTPQLTAFEEASFRAEVQAIERTYNVTLDADGNVVEPLDRVIEESAEAGV